MKPPSKRFTPSHPSAPWRVYWRGKSWWFTEEDRADKKIAELARAEIAAPAVRNKDLDEVRYARSLLKGVSIITAVRFYLEHNPTGSRAVELHDALESFKKSFKDLRPKTRIERVRNLRIFEEHFAGDFIGSVTRSGIETMLDDFESAHSYNALLKYVRQFFDWAVDRSYVGANPTRKHGNKRDIAMRKTKSSKVILSLDDSRHVIAICRAEFPVIFPAVVIQMFAGVRTEEIARYDWKHVRDTSLFIPSDVAKIGDQEGRVIDWLPDILAAVIKNRPEEGPIAINWKREKTRLLKRCRDAKPDFVWGQNAFRHSYATYGCAFWQSADRMKLLMGQHDADVFFNSYRRYATQADGAAYFGIF